MAAELDATQLFMADTAAAPEWHEAATGLVSGLAAAIGPSRASVREGPFSATSNRGGVAMAQRADWANVPLNFGIFHNVGARGGGVAATFPDPDSVDLRIGVDGFAAHGGGVRGVGPSVGVDNHAGGRAGLGLGVFGAVSRSFARRGEGTAPAGQVPVESREIVAPGIALDPSAATGNWGAGLKLVVTRREERAHRTTMPVAEADALVAAGATEAATWRGVAGQLARVRGLTGPQTVLPALVDPLGHGIGARALARGDRLIDQRTDTLTLGLAPGLAGLRAGVYVSHVGGRDVAITRLDGDRVRAAFSPRGVTALGAGVDALLLADLLASDTTARAAHHTFEFDLAVPAAHEAYLAAIAGRLPGALPEVAPMTDHAAWQQALAHEALPAGVVRLAAEQAEIPARRIGGGLPRPPLPAGAKVGGLSAHRTDLAELRHIARAGRSVEVIGRGHAHEQQRLLAGTRRLRLEATAEAVATDLSATPQFAFSRVRLTAAADKLDAHAQAELLALLTEGFGLWLSHGTAFVAGESVEVEIERAFTAGDLARLSATPVAALTAAAATAGADPRQLARLMVGLLDAPTPAAAAAALSDFAAGAAHEGRAASWRRLAGIGALHRLLGGTPDQLRIVVTHSAYGALPAEVTAFLAEPEPARPLPGHGQRRRRAARNLAARVARALAAAPGDPLAAAPGAPPRVTTQAVLAGAGAALAAFLA